MHGFRRNYNPKGKRQGARTGQYTAGGSFLKKQPMRRDVNIHGACFPVAPHSLLRVRVAAGGGILYFRKGAVDEEVRARGGRRHLLRMFPHCNEGVDGAQ